MIYARNSKRNLKIKASNVGKTEQQDLNNTYYGNAKMIDTKTAERNRKKIQRMKNLSCILNTIFYQNIFDQIIMKYGYGFIKNQLLKGTLQLT